MNPIHETRTTDVISSPIIVPKIANPYMRHYTDEHLDEYREEYSEILAEQPPPLYLNLLDSVEDLKSSTYQSQIIHKEKNKETPPIQEEIGCWSSFCLCLDSVWDYICCCFITTPLEINNPLLRRF